MTLLYSGQNLTTTTIMNKLFGMHIQAVAAASNYMYNTYPTSQLSGTRYSKGERSLQACLRNLKMIQNIDWWGWCNHSFSDFLHLPSSTPTQQLTNRLTVTDREDRLLKVQGRQGMFLLEQWSLCEKNKLYTIKNCWHNQNSEKHTVCTLLKNLGFLGLYLSAQR